MKTSNDFKKQLEEVEQINHLQRTQLVSNILKQGGVLDKGHVHFEDDVEEETNSDKEAFIKEKKQKYEDVCEEKQVVKSDGCAPKSKKKEIPFVPAYKKCQRQKIACPYGNQRRYYDKRIGFEGIDDPRLQLFEAQWFENKDVLDIGCHEGYIPITLAQTYHVTSMHGVDIDEKLIKKAYEHLEHEAACSSDTLSLEEPESEQCDKSNDKNNDKFKNDVLSIFGSTETYDLLKRVSFETKNFLEYNLDDCSIDTVICLSVTKWIHLNWGDSGLISLFHKIYNVLRPGGVLILEPQAWKSYRKNRQTTRKIHENYKKLTLRPDDFTSILINKVGFNSCKLIARTIQDTTKGFNRPMYLYTK